MGGNATLELVGGDGRAVFAVVGSECVGEAVSSICEIMRKPAVRRERSLSRAR